LIHLFLFLSLAGLVAALAPADSASIVVFILHGGLF
jgi:hypothetical protein